MRLFSSILSSLILLAATSSSGSSLPPISGKPTREVLLSAKAVSNLKILLGEKPGRSAGNVAPTGSMVPTLDESYIVVVEKTPFSELRQGQIAIFYASWTHNVIAHRLADRLLRGWNTKGDACTQIDPERLTENNFTGYRVVAAIKKTTGETKDLD